jgi:hypothetical protein
MEPKVIIQRTGVDKAGTVHGISGEKVIFDADGIAEVTKAVAEHFLQIPGYVLFSTKTEPSKDEDAILTEAEKIELARLAVAVEPVTEESAEPVEEPDSEPVTEEPTAGIDLEMIVLDLKKLSWQKQKSAIDKGEIPVSVLKFIVGEGAQDFSDAVKKAATQALEA